jgi:CheY-like chemotaxis protein
MNAKKNHVLLVEDNPGDARLLKEHLADASGRGSSETLFTLTSVERLSEAMKRIEEEPVDAVLLDLSLPDSHGLDTFDRLAAFAPALPIVVLSGLDDSAVASDAVRKGAQDYLVKGDVSGSLLRRAIQYAIQRKKSETARERLHSRVIPEMKSVLASALESLAACGALTGENASASEHLRRLRQSLDRLERLVAGLAGASNLES